MKFSHEVNLALTIISGLCWTLVYILIIYRSLKDKTYGMPFWALAFNICWEFMFSIVFSANADSVQLIVNRIWLAFDFFILIAYFAYGIREWPRYLSKWLFYPYSILVLIMSYLFIYFITIRLNEFNGMSIAFMQNLMMSWLFIAMLNNRKSLVGQSLGIAIFKMIGTLAPTLEFAGRHQFVLFLGSCCFIADWIYIVMVAKWKHTYKKRSSHKQIPFGQFSTSGK
ncbi:MAG TPA: hypothetical protein VN721_07370 [Flavipsychrobacter sp.]|nr:hypothetical protein [Flavipsychrobacter sp.]